MVGVHGTRFDMFRFFRMLALSEQGHGMEQRPRMVPASPLAASQRLPDDAAVTLGWGGRYVPMLDILTAFIGGLMNALHIILWWW